MSFQPVTLAFAFNLRFGFVVHRALRKMTGWETRPARSGYFEYGIASGWPALAATVDSQDLARDEVTQRACEEVDYASHFIDEGDSIECPF